MFNLLLLLCIVELICLPNWEMIEITIDANTAGKKIRCMHTLKGNEPISSRWAKLLKI